MRYLLLTLVLLFGLAGTVGCENNDPTGPVVNNSGDNSAFSFADDGPSSASTPAPVVVPPVFAPVEGAPAPDIVTPIANPNPTPP